MSETQKTKKKKTRLKGTETMRPCVDCGKMKNRFTAFKPRWAGCQVHRTERGRRFFQQGCGDCKALVNGNIRQPRCIECDKARPKKKKAATPTPIAAAVPDVLEAVEAAVPVAVSVSETKLLPPLPEPEPAVEATPEPEPVVVGQDEASVESVEVTPAPTAARPKIASVADLSKLFGGDE